MTNLLSVLELPVATISLLKGTLQVLKEPIFLKQGEGCATSSRTPNLQFLNVLATSICWDGWLLHISAHWTSSIALLAFLPTELAKDMAARMHHGIRAHLGVGWQRSTEPHPGYLPFGFLRKPHHDNIRELYLDHLPNLTWSRISPSTYWSLGAHSHLRAHLKVV